MSSAVQSMKTPLIESDTGQEAPPDDSQHRRPRAR